MQAILQATGLPCLGWLGKESALHIPERHLGLIPTVERSDNEENQLESLIQKAADAVERSFDLDKILVLAKERKQNPNFTFPPVSQTIVHPQIGKPRPRLAVARDEAFSFHYPDNLELLTEAGAELIFFSPLHDRQFPKDIDGLYLVGGFPELYARELSQNIAFLTGIRQLHRENRPIYAECGGLMALTEAVIDLEEQRWPMASIVPGETQMHSRLVSLGYRVATATSNNLLLAAGEQVRGHEFHYSSWTADESTLNGYHAWQLRRRQSDSESRLSGYCQGNLLASYIHVHFGQNPTLAYRFFEKLSKN